LKALNNRKVNQNEEAAEEFAKISDVGKDLSTNRMTALDKLIQETGLDAIKRSKNDWKRKRTQIY
jgi:hypothetical protein